MKANFHGLYQGTVTFWGIGRVVMISVFSAWQSLLSILTATRRKVMQEVRQIDSANSIAESGLKQTGIGGADRKSTSEILI